VTPHPPQLIKVIVILKEGIKQKKKDTRWLAIGRGMQNKEVFCGSINEYYMDIFWNNLNFW